MRRIERKLRLQKNVRFNFFLFLIHWSEENVKYPIKKSNLTEEILSITAGSDRGSYAKPLFVRALSSHSRVRESELSS
jgi:hypothetical protein